MGQFNNGYRRPNFSGSKDFYSPSNSSLAPVPASQPKSKTKLLIVVIVAAVILISIFAIIGVSTKKKDSYGSESDFLDDIESLQIEFTYFYRNYDQIIGLKPNIAASKNITPFQGIEEVLSDLNNVSEIFNTIKEFDEKKSELKSSVKQNVADLKSKLNSGIDKAQKNVDLLSIYNGLFTNSLEESLYTGECIKIDEPLAKISLNDQSKISTIKEYNIALCKIIQETQGVTQEATMDNTQDIVSDIMTISGMTKAIEDLNTQLEECNELSEVDAIIKDILKEERGYDEE